MRKHWKTIGLSLGILMATTVTTGFIMGGEEPLTVRVDGESLSSYAYHERKDIVKDLWGVIGYDLDDASLKYANQQIENHILLAMVEESFVSSMAKKHDVTVSEKEVNEVLERTPLNQGYPSSIRKDAVRSRLLEAKIYSKLAKSEKVTDKQIESFYEENKSFFNQGRQAEVKHMLFSKKEDASRAYVQLQEGQSFETVAKALSEDKSTAPYGGSIGTLNEQDLNKDLAKEVFSTKEGRFTPIIETEFGFQIVKVDKIIPALTYSLEEAKPMIEKRLRTQAATISYSKEMDEFLKRNGISEQ